MLLASLILYGVTIGLALSIPIGASAENWRPGVLVPILAALSPTAWLIARYVEDRKDRRELIAPINEVSKPLKHFRQGIELYTSALRQILGFAPTDRHWKIDTLSVMLNTLLEDKAAIKPALDESMEDCREAYRRTRGATFLRPEEQDPDIVEAIEFAAHAADRIRDVVARLHAEL